MRYQLFALVLCLSYLATAQHVNIPFDKAIIKEDFSVGNQHFAQRYNANEVLYLDQDKYLVKRLNQDDYSISYARMDKGVSSFRLVTSFELIKSKRSAAGIILHGQQSSNSGIIVEINNKCRYRVRKIVNGQERILSGQAKEGWIKSKKLEEKGINTVEVRSANGYYDLYFNEEYVASYFDLQFNSGSCGFVVKGGSELQAHSFDLYIQGSGPIVSGGKDTATMDQDFEQVVLLFKTKIDAQQKEIAQLQGELDQCRSRLNYDTTLVERSSYLEEENERLEFQIDSTTKALNAANNRLAYLESLREDIEAGSNGDLVLNLSSILAGVKEENAELKNENNRLEEENADLKNGQDIMLREIERLQKLLDLQNE